MLLAGREEDRSPEAVSEKKEKADKKVKNKNFADLDIPKRNLTPEIITSPAASWTPTQTVRNLLSGIGTLSERSQVNSSSSSELIVKDILYSGLRSLSSDALSGDQVQSPAEEPI